MSMSCAICGNEIDLSDLVKADNKLFQIERLLERYQNKEACKDLIHMVNFVLKHGNYDSCG